jgi:hypothetical protein
MTDTYPLILESETKGSLQVTKQGLITEFIARCPDPGRLVRLSVFGEGKEGYLGVMEPEGGELRLCRRFSRAAMAGFPETISYASEAGRSCQPAPAVDRKLARGGGGRPRQQDVLWRRVGDGSLFTVTGGKAYRAVPMANLGLPLAKASDRRVIEGVEYVIFPLGEQEQR